MLTEIQPISTSSYQINSIASLGSTSSENGPLLPIQRHDFNFTYAFFYFGGTLVGLYMVCDSGKGIGN